jgi:hypothetical protein
VGKFLHRLAPVTADGIANCTSLQVFPSSLNYVPRERNIGGLAQDRRGIAKEPISFRAEGRPNCPGIDNNVQRLSPWAILLNS